jgi:hypothetical protein
MIYFMHTKHSGEFTQLDEEGYNRSSLESMRVEAVYGARALMSASIMQGLAPELQSSFDITDEAGLLLLNVLFADTLDGSMPKREPRTTWDD